MLFSLLFSSLVLWKLPPHTSPASRTANSKNLTAIAGFQPVEGTCLPHHLLVSKTTLCHCSRSNVCWLWQTLASGLLVFKYKWSLKWYISMKRKCFSPMQVHEHVKCRSGESSSSLTVRFFFSLGMENYSHVCMSGDTQGDSYAFMTALAAGCKAVLKGPRTCRSVHAYTQTHTHSLTHIQLLFPS